ncbi:MAG: hypothetical protein C0599_13635 [Salinivirgaceae bacterium]|nr:MAG: hypothetical protein C0599_13635 [Salinivirgaceae bacterium]
MRKTYLKYLKITLVAILSIWFIKGCIDDNFELDKLNMHTENEGIWGIPLVKTSFVMEDLVNIVDTTGFVDTDDEGLILLVYTDTGYSATAREEIVFPDQSYDTLFNEQDYQNAGGFQGGLVTMSKANINYLFIAAAANQLLDSMYIESSLLDIDIRSTFKYQGSVTLTFPELKKDGVAYQKVIPINDASGNFVYNNTFDDLDGYMLDFTNFTEPNNFFITYQVELIENTGSGAVNPNAICDVDVNFREIQYEYIWGYLGTQTLDIPAKELKLDFFSAFDVGEFELYDPRIKINVINSFGLSVGISLPTFKMKLSDDTWNDIVGPEVPTAGDPWIFYSPEESYPAPIIPTDTTVKISGVGTNLNELVAQLPKKLTFGGAAKLNPEESGERTNFMSKDSRVNAIVDFEIPMWGRTSGITFQDTMDLDLGNISEDMEMIKFVDLKLDVENGLPHSLGLVAYLTDSLYNIIDTIPNANDWPSSDTLWIVESGVIGPDSLINQETGKTHSTSIIRYEEDVDLLDNVKYLLLNIKFLTTDGDTPNPPYVKYYDYYEMDFKVSADWQFEINEDL